MRLLLAETRSMYWQSAWSRSRSKLGKIGDRVRADVSQTSISRVLPCPRSSHGPTDQRRGAQSATSPCAGIPQCIPPLAAPQGPGQANIPRWRPKPGRGEAKGSPPLPEPLCSLGQLWGAGWGTGNPGRAPCAHGSCELGTPARGVSVARDTGPHQPLLRGAGAATTHRTRGGEIPVVHQRCVDRVRGDGEEGQQLLLQALQRPLQGEAAAVSEEGSGGRTLLRPCSNRRARSRARAAGARRVRHNVGKVTCPTQLCAPRKRPRFAFEELLPQPGPGRATGALWPQPPSPATSAQPQHDRASDSR